MHDSSILVVEDDPYIGELVAHILEEACYTAKVVPTGSAAQAALREGGIDLVVLDWMLPDTEGVDLCRMIKQQSHEQQVFLPVLMLTARSTLADRVAGLDAGADDYLTKPFHTDELLARVRALLRIRSVEQERADALVALAQKHAAMKDAYEQLRAAQAQLAQTSRLAALGELVAGVAHELNNPLAIILGNVELLPELPDEEDRRAVDQITTSAQRARRVVQSLVAFARQGKMEEAWHLPTDLLSRVLDLRQAAIRTSGIELRIVRGEDLPTLWVDGPQIQQVLLNLLMNAEYALQDRPNPCIEIHLFTRPMPVPPPTVLGRVPASDGQAGGPMALVIDISDNGCGITPEVAPKLFQPFVTTKPVGEGTGLGLAISYGIIVQHGGALLFASELGVGTTFRIVLPANRDTQAAVSIQAPLAAPTPRRLLVIDDEPDMLDMLRRLLSRRGYSVTTMSSAREALELLERELFDIILCDIRMPGMDGTTFYEQLQRLSFEREPRIVIMTGDTSNPRTEHFLRTRDLDVLRKPFTTDDLVRVLEQED
ncbi:MAG TPA: response regulator [Roseiflexaceae bacterium]|nr:response regulator [Roseiflexaceae bacterium]